MRKTGLAVFFVSVLILAVGSMGYAQSAEDLAKGQSVGVRYTMTRVEDGLTATHRIYIRGDEVTWTVAKGSEPELTMLQGRVTNKHIDGNKLILETNLPPYPRMIIDGYRLIIGAIVLTRE
jgi:hypothetical protein